MVPEMTLHIAQKQRDSHGHGLGTKKDDRDESMKRETELTAGHLEMDSHGAGHTWYPLKMQLGSPIFWQCPSASTWKRSPHFTHPDSIEHGAPWGWGCSNTARERDHHTPIHPGFCSEYDEKVIYKLSTKPAQSRPKKRMMLVGFGGFSAGFT